MDKFRTFKDFFYFYKELAYIFALGYIFLIAVIIFILIMVDKLIHLTNCLSAELLVLGRIYVYFE